MIKDEIREFLKLKLEGNCTNINVIRYNKIVDHEITEIRNLKIKNKCSLKNRLKKLMKQQNIMNLLSGLHNLIK